MTKLEKCIGLIELIDKLHKRRIDIDFDLHLNHLEIYHWKHDESDSFVKFVIETKRDYTKAINYLKSL